MSDAIQALLPAVWRHLLETTIVVVAVALVVRLLRRHPAWLRHMVWLGASVKFLVPFSLLIAFGTSIDWSGRPVVEIPVSAEPAPVPPIPVPTMSLRPMEVSVVPAVLAAAWLVGILAVLAAWLRTRFATRRVLQTGRRIGTVPRCAAALSDVRVSPVVASPGVYGLFRPVLLLPEDIERRLGPEELDAVVAHEVAHVARRDNLTSAFHMVVTALFWFHPFVWWIGRQLVHERERASDEAALRAGSVPEVYAGALLKICRTAVGLPAECVAGISGANLKTRVEEIMRHPRTNARGRWVGMAVGLMAVVVVAVPVTWGLATPTIEFVSVEEERALQGRAVSVQGPAPEVEAVGLGVGPGVGLGVGPGGQAPSSPISVRGIQTEAVETGVSEEAQEFPEIGTDEERAAFEALETDEERERFIEQFWLRRDPTPGTGINEAREEHYRRIAYANEQFAYDGIPGSESDRGVVYIRYGDPDSQDAVPAGGVYYRMNREGGDDSPSVAVAEVYPFEQWRYNYIEGVGRSVVFEFVDSEESGEYSLAETPDEKFVAFANEADTQQE